MATKNNITGDLIKSRHNSDKYAANYDAIFKKKPEPKKRTLNPCQACGSEDLELTSETSGHHSMDYVVCRNCKREGLGEFSISDAISSWNRANP